MVLFSTDLELIQQIWRNISGIALWLTHSILWRLLLLMPQQAQCNVSVPQFHKLFSIGLISFLPALVPLLHVAHGLLNLSSFTVLSQLRLTTAPSDLRLSRKSLLYVVMLQYPEWYMYSVSTHIHCCMFVEMLNKQKEHKRSLDLIRSWPLHSHQHIHSNHLLK